MTYKNNLKQVGKTLIIFCLPIVFFLIILLTSYSKTKEFSWVEAVSKSAVFSCIVWTIAIPGLILHYNYYMYEKNRFLTFGINFLELSDPLKIVRINYSEILEVKQFQLAWSNKNPWNHYGYTKVYSKNGSSIIFTNLLNDQEAAKRYFTDNNIPFKVVDKLYTWVK